MANKMKFINSKTKTLTLAGLIFLGANTIETKAQYSQGGWKPVTESEFNRLKISEDSIQTVDLTKNKDSSHYTDNSKRGKKFTNTNGEKYFWVNPAPTGDIYSFDKDKEKLNQPKYQTKKENLLDNSNEEKLTEAQQLETLINDPEIKNLIKDFNSNFQVEFAYAYLGEDIMDKTGHLWKKGSKMIIPVELQEKYLNGTILKDKKTSKDVLVIEGKYQKDYELKNFLGELLMTGGSRYIKSAICRLVSYGKREHPQISLKTLEEKKNFIKPYFTDSIPNAIKNLPKYKAPLIYKDEWLSTMDDGKSVNYKNNIKLDNAKPAKSVEMNEQKLDEILKEGEK